MRSGAAISGCCDTTLFLLYCPVGVCWIPSGTLGGAMNFASDEAREWGTVMQRASQLVCEFTGCERIDTIAFGEGARHLHQISCSEEDPCATV